jgi:hypothetical protein
MLLFTRPVKDKVEFVAEINVLGSRVALNTQDTGILERSSQEETKKSRK